MNTRATYRSKWQGKDTGGSPVVLSTKILLAAQKEALIRAGLRVVDYNAISIAHLDAPLPEAPVEALIFTSQNGVRSFLGHSPSNAMKKLPVFCVGQKTAALLQDNGFSVRAIADSARELATLLCAGHRTYSFCLVAGTNRREELPQMLSSNGVAFTEMVTYSSTGNPKGFERDFDAALFFSPSGVSSFFKENALAGRAFCIGHTTGNAVKRYTNNYSIAPKPTVEGVIAQTIDYFNPKP